MPTFNFSLDANLSQAVYSSNNSNTSPIISGWQPIQINWESHNPSATFGAQLYVKDGQYKVVYRGTENNLADWEQNIKYGTFQNSLEFQDTAVFMARAIAAVSSRESITDVSLAAARITTTGHSQGGFEAELASVLFGIKGTSLDGMCRNKGSGLAFCFAHRCAKWQISQIT